MEHVRNVKIILNQIKVKENVYQINAILDQNFWKMEVVKNVQIILYHLVLAKNAFQHLHVNKMKRCKQMGNA